MCTVGAFYIANIYIYYAWVVLDLNIWMGLLVITRAMGLTDIWVRLGMRVDCKFRLFSDWTDGPNFQGLEPGDCWLVVSGSLGLREVSAGPENTTIDL